MRISATFRAVGEKGIDAILLALQINYYALG